MACLSFRQVYQIGYPSRIAKIRWQLMGTAGNMKEIISQIVLGQIRWRFQKTKKLRIFGSILISICRIPSKKFRFNLVRVKNVVSIKKFILLWICWIFGNFWRYLIVDNVRHKKNLQSQYSLIYAILCLDTLRYLFVDGELQLTQYITGARYRRNLRYGHCNDFTENVKRRRFFRRYWASPLLVALVTKLFSF